jgi:DNA-binding response OmpR family regulator
MRRKMTRTGQARVLVVDDEPAIAEVCRDTLQGMLGCQVTCARNLGEARKALKRREIDLLVTDIMLPDGSGLALLDELHAAQPRAWALVISGLAGLDAAVGAMRGGAVDFVAKPFTGQELAERVRRALEERGRIALRESRLARLRSAFRRLNQARHEVSKKVDLLCNDLISAYGELSRQMESTRLQQSFRQFIEQAHGLEQLLCHSMDWMLRQLGYSNIGIWLIGQDQELQLGAYMKYSVPAGRELMQALQKNLLRTTIRRGFVRLRAADAPAMLTPAELRHLSGHDILAINCTYMGETLAVITLYRDGRTPYTDDDASALRTVSPMFALALARMVKGIDGPDPEPDHPGPADEPKKKAKPRTDPADWWKRGEEPPF